MEAWFLVVPELILKGRFRAIPLRNTGLARLKRGNGVGTLTLISHPMPHCDPAISAAVPNC